MNFSERPFKVIEQAGERPVRRGRPADQNIVEAGARPFDHDRAGRLPQAPADPVSDNRIADLACHRKPDSRLSLAVAPSCLKNEPGFGLPPPLGHSHKFMPFGQPFQRRSTICRDIGGRDAGTPPARSRPGRLCRQPLAAARAPAGQDKASALGLFAGAKSVPPLANQSAGLKCAFQNRNSAERIAMSAVFRVLVLATQAKATTSRALQPLSTPKIRSVADPAGLYGLGTAKSIHQPVAACGEPGPKFTVSHNSSHALERVCIFAGARLCCWPEFVFLRQRSNPPAAPGNGKKAVPRCYTANPR